MAAKKPRDPRENLVKEVIKEYSRQTAPCYRFLSDTLRWAMLDAAVMTVLKAQDDRSLTIGLFIHVSNVAFDRVFNGGEQ